MKSYQLVSHTADIRLKIEADTLQNLFVAACVGMTDILKKGFCQRVKSYPISYKLSLSSTDPTILLIDFLSEILTKIYEKQALFCEVEFEKFDKISLSAKIFGQKIPEGFDEDIKAVTYHEAEVKKNQKGKWQTTVVFDI